MTNIFNVTKNADTLTGSANQDTFIVAGPTTDLSSADTINGVGAGNRLVFEKAGTIVDAQFTNVFKIAEIDLAATAGSYSLTLGSAASVTGVTTVDASLAGGMVTIDASGDFNPLTVFTGKGANVLLGTIGDDQFLFDGAKFTSADKVNGAGIGDHDQIVVYGKAVVADSAFTNVKNVEVLTIGTDFFNSDPAPAKVTLGKLSQAAGIVEVQGFLDDGMTLDAGARTVGVAFHGNSGIDVFIGSAGNDSFNGGADSDSYRVKAANLSAGDSIDGGTGIDEIRVTDAGTILDAAFTKVSSIEHLVFDGSGKQTVTLGSLAQAGGITTVDAAKVTGGLVLNAAAMTSGLNIVMGIGTDSLTLGGMAGTTNNIYVQSGKLTGADHIFGSAATDVLHFTDAIKLTDAYFAGLSGSSNSSLNVLDLDNHAKGQSLTAGANFTGFVQQSGNIGTVVATSNDPTSSFTFDFSAYAGPALTVAGTAGSDVFIEGAVKNVFIGAAAASSSGTYGGDTIKFASQFFDGQHLVAGIAGAANSVMITDAKTAVVDNDFIGISSIGTLQLGPTKTDSYDVTFGSHGITTGVSTIDASQAGVDVKINTVGATAFLTVIAGAKDNTLTDGASYTTFLFAPKTLTAGDVVDGGTGTDAIKFSGAGSVTAAALVGIKGVEEVILSDAGNSVILPDSLGATINGAAPSLGNIAIDFLVLGGKGNDTVDLSMMSPTDYVGVIAGSGNDRLIGSQGKTNYFIFAAPGDLTSGDQIKAGHADAVVVVGAGTFKADVFKGMTGVGTFMVDDQVHPSQGSTITLNTAAVQQTGYHNLVVTVIGTGNDVIDASAATGAANYVDFKSGGGNDTLIGPASGGRFAFDQDGTGGFLLDGNDKIVGGSNRGTIALTDQAGGMTAVTDSDFAGVSGVPYLQLYSTGYLFLSYGANAAAAGINWIDGQGVSGGLVVSASGTSESLQVLLGTGLDSIDLGSGDDIVVVNGFINSSLTSADHIDGGGGTNKLHFAGDAVLVDGNFTDVSHIQELDLTSDNFFTQSSGFSVTLGNAANKAGVEIIDGHASAAAVTIDATLMANGLTIHGSVYADTLKGGSSSDLLEGGYGGDKLTGGVGPDVFAIHSAADSRQLAGNNLSLADLITDFKANQLDTVNLQGLGLNASAVTERSAGAFATTNTVGFFGAHDVALQYDGTSETRLYGDVNHNGNFDLGVDTVVRISGDHAHELATNSFLIVT